MRLKAQAYRILEDHEYSSAGALVVRGGIGGLIVLSTAAVILESVEPLRVRWEPIFIGLERSAVVAFSVEYLIRLWSITVNTRYSRPVTGRLRYAATPFAIIDLLAILPAYFAFGAASELLMLRTLRLVRVFRLFKLARYSAALRSLGGALSSKREEIAVTLFVLSILLVIASSLMYYVESTAQPEHFSSIPAAMWWAVVTLTTVGYGDVCPVTPMGKVIGAFVSVLGAGLFAMPAAIWGAAFVERVINRRAGPQICPHCGRAIDSREPPGGGTNRDTE